MLETLEEIKPQNNDSVLLATGLWIINILIVGLIVSLIIFLTTKNDRFVRLHALQAAMMQLLLFATAIIISCILFLGSLILAFFTSGIGALGIVLIFPVLTIIAICGILLYLYCGYRAHRGEIFLLPIIGRIALRMV